MAKREEYQRLILPHLPAAYNLARWLMRHPQDAEDAVQDAMLRAWRAFDGYAGGDAASWVLSIVRNTCYTALARRQRQSNVVRIDSAMRSEIVAATAETAPAPDEQAHERLEARRLHAAIERLPELMREVIVLREIESLSYAQIAAVTTVPIGTVMSRLARARDRLRTILEQDDRTDVHRHEL